MSDIDDHEFIKQYLREIKDLIKEQNGRIRKLEDFRWFLAGGMGVITIVLIPVAMIVFSN